MRCYNQPNCLLTGTLSIAVIVMVVDLATSVNYDEGAKSMWTDSGVAEIEKRILAGMNELRSQAYPGAVPFKQDTSGKLKKAADEMADQIVVYNSVHKNPTDGRQDMQACYIDKDCWTVESDRSFREMNVIDPKSIAQWWAKFDKTNGVGRSCSNLFCKGLGRRGLSEDKASVGDDSELVGLAFRQRIRFGEWNEGLGKVAAVVVFGRPKLHYRDAYDLVLNKIEKDCAALTEAFCNPKEAKTEKGYSGFKKDIAEFVTCAKQKVNEANSYAKIEAKTARNGSETTFSEELLKKLCPKYVPKSTFKFDTKFDKAIKAGAYNDLNGLWE